jgi:membrane protease YdiL (CAAX protease family)
MNQPDNEFNDKPQPPSDDPPADQRLGEPLPEPAPVPAASTEFQQPALSQEPPPVFVPAPSPLAFLPADLQITWSWAHLVFFAVFAFGSIIVIDIFLAVYLAAGQRVAPKDLEQLLQSRPELAVIFNVVWFFLILLFLYVTLGLLRGRPFWQTIGWKRLGISSEAPANPWIYFLGGIGLAILVAIATAKVKTPEHMPMQDLFKNRTSAILLMGMAVLVAPLVEETVFRGYLYPLFASTTSRIAKGFGANTESAIRVGMTVGVVVTGTLFGLLHGAQLGWTRALVLMLTIVGIIFTFARARAQTVLASFLLHLGYNFFIAFAAIVSTKGFTVLPPK